MSKRFSLGSFFGLTATDILLFEPKSISQLLGLRYATQIVEDVYSLEKEFEFLGKSMNSFNETPDLDSIVSDFKELGHLGLTDSDTDAKAKMLISKFAKDVETLSDEELRNKYGSGYASAKSDLYSGSTVDTYKLFNNVEDANVREACSKITKILYDKKNTIQEYIDKCKACMVLNSREGDSINGISLHEIIGLDNDKDISDGSCCRFIKNLYRNIRMSSDTALLNEYYRTLESNILRIQEEYEAEDIQLTPTSTIVELLRNCYECVGLNQLNEILDMNLTLVEMNEVFSTLDKIRLGGLSIHCQERGSRLVDTMSRQGEKTWQRRKGDHNEKLDNLLAMAYADLKSREYTQKVSR